MDNEIKGISQKKIRRCTYSHPLLHNAINESTCIKDGWDDDKVKEVNEDICEACKNFKSRYIEYPITVNDIETEEIKYNDSWQYKLGTLCAIRPCDKAYEGKTYLGIFLGDLPISLSASYHSETKVLTVRTFNNPGIFVPELGKIIFGCESWWHIIKTEKDLKDITTDDIENTWYVKLLNNLKND